MTPPRARCFAASWRATAGRRHEADDGKAGLTRLTEFVPQVVLPVLVMPEMDGFEFLVEVGNREALRSLPVRAPMSVEPRSVLTSDGCETFSDTDRQSTGPRPGRRHDDLYDSLR
jgi:hypothetical protein